MDQFKNDLFKKYAFGLSKDRIKAEVEKTGLKLNQESEYNYSYTTRNAPVLMIFTDFGNGLYMKRLSFHDGKEFDNYEEKVTYYTNEFLSINTLGLKVDPRREPTVSERGTVFYFSDGIQNGYDASIFVPNGKSGTIDYSIALTNILAPK